MWKRSTMTLSGLASAILASLATPAAAELNVVVTIKPIHSLVAGVMAGTGTPKLSSAAAPPLIRTR